MNDGSGGTTALLGIDGFVVLNQTEEAGEIWLLVETDRDVAGCPECGVRALGHGRSVVQVRDLPISGRPVRLVWRKRRWRCGDADCATKSFTETSELVEGSRPGGARSAEHTQAESRRPPDPSDAACLSIAWSPSFLRSMPGSCRSRAAQAQAA